MVRFFTLIVIVVIAVIVGAAIYFTFFNSPTPASVQQNPPAFRAWSLSPKAIIMGTGTWTQSQGAWTFNAKGTGEVIIEFWLANVGSGQADCTVLTASPGVTLTESHSYGQVAISPGQQECAWTGQPLTIRMDVPSPSPNTTYTVSAKNGQEQMQIIQTA